MSKHNMLDGPDRKDNARIIAETVEAVARDSHGKLVALLASRDGDIAAAEDALSEAFSVALTQWPESGPPANPEAWLLTVARRKRIDAARKDKFSIQLDEDLSRITVASNCDSSPSGIPDQRLALIFACAHPAIDQTIRTCLILQVLLGLNVDRIASAFLTSPSAMAKRLVRAKVKIREARIVGAIAGAVMVMERLTKQRARGAQEGKHALRFARSRESDSNGELPRANSDGWLGNLPR